MRFFHKRAVLVGIGLGLPILLIIAVILREPLLRWVEGNAVYGTPLGIGKTPADYGMRYQDVYLTAKDGARLYGWYIQTSSPIASHPWAVMFCHGNSGSITHRLPKVNAELQAGADVFLFDYRGFGRSKGLPINEDRSYLDGEAAYRYLTKTRHVSPDRLVIYGESLGCAVAVELARRHPLRGLILESAFTSTVAMGYKLIPFIRWEKFVKYRYDNLAKIPGLKIPILIMHGRQDWIVPFRMGRQLYEAATGDKRFVELQGGHILGFMNKRSPYAESIAAFLQRLNRPS